MFYAVSHKTEGMLAAATPGCGQQEHSSDTGKESHTEVYEQISADFSEQYGPRTQRSPGSLSVPRRQQDICLSSCGDAAEYPEESTFRQNAKRLQSGRLRNSQDYYGEQSGSPYVNSTGIHTTSGGRENASDGQLSDDERTGRKEGRDQVFNNGVSGRETSAPANYTTTTKTQVSNVALQTDACDMLYVTKNTLTVYTIAIVQHSQALQYDQMHAALQTVRNQASLEMPLRADELLTAHFNLAVLGDQRDFDISPDAQKPAVTTQDTKPSASVPDEQTYIKIPSHCAENSASKRPHPTGAVAPTHRREYGLVNAIPAGYESDDSWDSASHTHEHTHTHNIVPLLALHTQNNCPHRSHEQQKPRQNNNISVRTGHAPYSRPWDNQPYGRQTRSQQALHARAYRKIQCRYPIQET